eukprot:Opistho-2@41041
MPHVVQNMSARCVHAHSIDPPSVADGVLLRLSAADAVDARTWSVVRSHACILHVFADGHLKCAVVCDAPVFDAFVAPGRNAPPILLVSLESGAFAIVTLPAVDSAGPRKRKRSSSGASPPPKKRSSHPESNLRHTSRLPSEWADDPILGVLTGDESPAAENVRADTISESGHKRDQKPPKEANRDAHGSAVDDENGLGDYDIDEYGNRVHIISFSGDARDSRVREFGAPQRVCAAWTGDGSGPSRDTLHVVLCGAAPDGWEFTLCSVAMSDIVSDDISEHDEARGAVRVHAKSTLLNATDGMQPGTPSVHPRVIALQVRSDDGTRGGSGRASGCAALGGVQSVAVSLFAAFFGGNHALSSLSLPCPRGIVAACTDGRVFALSLDTDASGASIPRVGGDGWVCVAGASDSPVGFGCVRLSPLGQKLRSDHLNSGPAENSTDANLCDALVCVASSGRVDVIRAADVPIGERNERSAGLRALVVGRLELLSFHVGCHVSSAHMLPSTGDVILVSNSNIHAVQLPFLDPKSPARASTPVLRCRALVSSGSTVAIAVDSSPVSHSATQFRLHSIDAYGHVNLLVADAAPARDADTSAADTGASSGAVDVPGLLSDIRHTSSEHAEIEAESASLDAILGFLNVVAHVATVREAAVAGPDAKAGDANLLASRASSGAFSLSAAMAGESGRVRGVRGVRGGGGGLSATGVLLRASLTNNTGRPLPAGLAIFSRVQAREIGTSDTPRQGHPVSRERRPGGAPDALPSACSAINALPQLDHGESFHFDVAVGDWPGSSLSGFTVGVAVTLQLPPGLQWAEHDCPSRGSDTTDVRLVDVWSGSATLDSVDMPRAGHVRILGARLAHRPYAQCCTSQRTALWPCCCSGRNCSADACIARCAANSPVFPAVSSSRARLVCGNTALHTRAPSCYFLCLRANCSGSPQRRRRDERAVHSLSARKLQCAKR